MSEVTWLYPDILQMETFLKDNPKLRGSTPYWNKTGLLCHSSGCDCTLRMIRMNSKRFNVSHQNNHEFLLSIYTSGRWQSKTLILSMKLDQTSLETEFSIAICRPTGDKWLSKTLFLAIFDPQSSIVKNCSYCRLFGMIYIIMYVTIYTHLSLDYLQSLILSFKYTVKFKCLNKLSKVNSNSLTLSGPGKLFS